MAATPSVCITSDVLHHIVGRNEDASREEDYLRRPWLLSKRIFSLSGIFTLSIQMDLLRDSTLGQIVRLMTGNRCLLYPEERAELTRPIFQEKNSDVSDLGGSPPGLHPKDLASLEQGVLPQPHPHGGEVNCVSQSLPAGTLDDRIDEELCVPDGKTILVEWYDMNDPENPQNWSTGKKSLITAILWLYTFTVYCGSAIYTPSINGVMGEYGVSHTASVLGLSLYVLGYGVGPLLFSPISEIPRIGRNWPYIITLFLYVLLSIPTALVRSFPGFLVLRFLTGFLGSPCLATGGATLQDMYSSMTLPYGYTAWVGATFCAPALGPVISAFAVAEDQWRWSLWEILWMGLFTFIVMLAFFPETSSATILFRRAQRLRLHLQDQRYVSQSEIDEANLTVHEVVRDALLRPLQITILDPAVFFTNFYSSYSYGVYYSFFEAFPLVYTEKYGFSLGLTGTSFLSIVVACLFGTLIYLIYVYWYLEPKLRKHGPGLQEERLVPAIFASILQPIGLFLFAWSSRPEIHWIVSLTGVVLFSTGGFVLFQGIFMYLPLSYPRYSASLFAANDFFRSAWAAGAVLYATPLFKALGIARGVSLLGGLSCGGVLGVSALYLFGARLRARSKFADA